MVRTVDPIGVSEDSLRRFRVLDSRDMDETQERIAQCFKPHRLSVLGQRRAAPSRMDHLRLGRTSVSRLSYGADVLVQPDWLDFYLLQIPLSGSVDVYYGGERIECAERTAVLVSPHVPYQLRWNARAEQIIVTVGRACMDNYLRSVHGRDGGRPATLDARIDLGAAATQPLRAAVEWICRAPDLAGGMARDPRVGAELDRVLAASLAACWQDGAWAAEEAVALVPAPRFVRKAEEFLRAHLDTDLTAVDLAEHAGVSVRSLQSGFRKYRDTTPMALLRELRLEKVRAALLNPEETASVSDIASRWGFVHMSHFAAAYRKRYGERPTSTRWR